MWRDLESDALLIGLDLNYFWSLNPKQYAKHIEIFNKKEEIRLKEVKRQIVKTSNKRKNFFICNSYLMEN